MKIRAILIFSAAVTFPCVLNAQVIITELMYDLDGTDTGREWIEVKNVGTEPIDLSLMKLFESGTNHSVSALGDPFISAGGFAIIADNTDKFKEDHPDYSVLLFDSAFSLNNTSETITLKSGDGVEIDNLSYTSSLGAAGNGLSLQKTDTIWIAASPTIGSDTVATSSESPPAANGDQDDETHDAEGDESENASVPKVVIIHSSHSSQSVANGSYDEPELVVTSGRPRLGYVGVPLSFEAKVKSMKNMPLGNSVGSTWSMGDGAQKSGQFISHTYDYPGEYTVILNSSSGGANAVSKVKVTIVDPKVTIREANESFIEVANLDSRELNIGSWIIETRGRRFVVPQDTIIPERSSLKLSSRNTKLDQIEEYARIANPSGRILSSIDGSVAFSAPVEDPVIALPPGMTAETLKERIAMSVHGSIARRMIDAGQGGMAKATTGPQVAAATAAATSSFSAAVIYTVVDTPEKSWWGKIISFIKE